MNIRELAELCGVSSTTVSRILNNRSDVNPQTRERVIRMMNEVGFKPMLKAGGQETIGVVMPEKSNTEFIGELIRGMTETAFFYGKNLTLISVQSDAIRDTENIKHYCRSNGLSGMIVLNPPLNLKLPQFLEEKDIPHVILAATYPDSDISWVDVDNTGGCKEAVRHMIDLGHRRIALFYNTGHPCDRDRVAGYLEALEEAGIEKDERLMFENVERRMDAAEMLSSMRRQPDSPTAVFCTTYRSTLMVLNQLQKDGVRIPDDLSLAGFGDYEVSPLTHPPLTSVHQPVYDLGKTAIEAFMRQLEAGGKGRQQHMLPTRLIVRDSTAAPARISNR